MSSGFEEKNIDCVLAILRKKNPASTKDILALRDLFPELCSGCASGGDVILAGKKLVEEGIVERKWTSSGFLWELVHDPETEG
ncbi:MAG: hypothetical protein K9W46_08730 [Candidatus Heimdallarchaeum endolithica]|uniref:Uncharacterized protein n=1 Tax=Candidatus Heimdallarchaeum endolithica TaxID=2876572 RepID=A0A9Y1FMV8_9ARCH|nr:MAG: hypothetical protein K9W46_08730 [Candidatus Heimdallarchaeum endolithica]